MEYWDIREFREIKEFNKFKEKNTDFPNFSRLPKFSNFAPNVILNNSEESLGLCVRSLLVLTTRSFANTQDDRTAWVLLGIMGIVSYYEPHINPSKLILPHIPIYTHNTHFLVRRVADVALT
jgi:hypothetical protein